MTCLTIVQNACLRIGITSPTAVCTSLDQQVLQLLALANEEGQSLAERVAWQSLTYEKTFTTVATEFQLTLSSISAAPIDNPAVKFVINDTIWNRTLRRPVFGPLAPQGWQQQKAMLFQGPWNQYRIRQNAIYFLPIPTAGQACYFEFITNQWAGSADLSMVKSSFTVDSDQVFFVDENLLTLGLIWRWKQQKGFDFDADYKKYEQQVMNAMGRDASKPILNMGDQWNELQPIVLVPSGSWPIA